MLLIYSRSVNSLLIKNGILCTSTSNGILNKKKIMSMQGIFTLETVQEIKWDLVSMCYVRSSIRVLYYITGPHFFTDNILNSQWYRLYFLRDSYKKKLNVFKWSEEVTFRTLNCIVTEVERSSRQCKFQEIPISLTI